MSDKTRIKIATGLTALFLAALSVAGLATRHRQPDSAFGSPVVTTTAHDTGVAPVSDDGERADDDSSRDHDHDHDDHDDD